jgi:hypothetical protein
VEAAGAEVEASIAEEWREEVLVRRLSGDGSDEQAAVVAGFRRL